MMHRAAAAIVILTAPALQETHELKWDLKEGRKFACSWVTDLRAATPDSGPLMDFKFEVRGTLTVGRVDRETAPCELVLTTYSLKGTVGSNPVDILYENGEVRRPDPESAGGKNILRECRKPAVLKLTSRGGYSFEGKHIIQGMFEGQSDFFGSRLPPAPVAVGATWEGSLESPQAKAAGRPPLKVLYKLESKTGDAARIVLDNRQDIKAAGKVLDFHAVTESFFDVRAGHCTRAKAAIRVNDTTDPRRAAPEKPDIEMTLQFEMTEKK